MNHTFEIPLETFGPLRPGQTSISHALVWQHGEKGPGVSSAPLSSFGPEGPGPGRLPVELMEQDDTVKFVVPVPPGVAALTAYAQFGSKSAAFSANDGPFLGYEPHLYPVGHNPNTDSAPTDSLRELRMTTFTAKSFGAYDPALGRIGPILFMGLSFEWTLGVGGAALYEAWIAAGRPETPMPAPENHEQLTLRLIEHAGLIPPLMLLAKETNQGAFVQQAIESGTWAGMLKLVELAKQEAR